VPLDNCSGSLPYFQWPQRQKDRAFSMGSFKSGPLSSLLLIGLLAWIAVVLIAPQVDLPDAAFQGNGSPLGIHSLTREVPQRDANIGAPEIALPPSDASDLALMVFFCDKAVGVPSLTPRILCC